MSGSHVDPNESIDLEEVSALAHEYAADSPDKKKDNNNADNSNANTNNNDNDDNNDTPTAASSALTPTKEVYVNSPSPQTTNNRTPSPVAQAKAQFEQGQGSPPSISRTTPPKASSGSGLAEMPPKKNALFSQWQAKTANSAPIDFSKKNVGVTSPTNNASGGRVPYTGKRWSPPKAAGSSSSSNKPFNVNDVGAVSASAALLVNKESTTTPPLPPKPVVKTPPRTSNTPPTLLRRDGSTVVATTTSSSPAFKKQTKNIDEIESSLDDLRELKEQLRLATAAAGSGVIEVSPDKFTKNKDIDTKADIQGLKEDIDNDWKEKKEKVKMLKKGEHSPKVKKNKMASYWQKTTTGAPPLKMDEKVSFRGYGAATTPALDTSNRSTGNKGSGSGETPPPDVKAGGGMATLAQSPSVGSGNKPEEEEEGGEDFRSKVVKLVRQVMPGEIDHIDELIDEYEGRETELLDTLNAMLENEELLGQYDDMDKDDDGDGTSSAKPDVSSTVASGVSASGEIENASATPWKDNTNADDEEEGSSSRSSISKHFKAVAAVASQSSTHTAPEETPEVGSDDSDDATPHVSNKNGKSGVLKAVAMADPVGGGDEESALPPTGEQAKSLDNEEDEGAAKRKCTAKRLMIIGLIILLVVVAAVVGAVVGTSGGGSDKNGTPSKNQDNDDYVTKSDDEFGIATGLGGATPATQEPTPSPKEGDTDTGSEDDGLLVTADADMSACLIGRKAPQELSTKSLKGNYPKVAIDGDKAVVASGSGYVAFFERNPTTNTWSRTQVFGLMVNVGDITSVAISGNVAVIGAPQASTDISRDDEPLQTGAIFIYEFDDTTLFEWRQKKGAYIPNEYKRSTLDTYDMANFGNSVDVDGDLIVVGAPEERSNRGSVTIFRRDEVLNEWVELERIEPQGLCGAEFFGYTVSIYEDVIAASADCDINIVLYKARRDDDDSSDIRIIPFQEMEYIDPKYGAVSSIAMSWNSLVYSTVSGGLFFYKRDNRDKRFFKNQELSFELPNGDVNLYEYRLSMDGNMAVLSVMNDVFLYMQDANSMQWKQEPLVLESEGDYAGYVGASLDLSDGHLLVAEKQEVNAHDFTACLLEEDDFEEEGSSPVESTPDTVPSPPVVESTKSPTPNPTQGATPNPTNEPSNPPTPKPTPAPSTAVATPSDCDGGHTLDISVTLDQYPQDTRWEIIPQGQSAAIATSPPYDESLQFSPADTFSVCLPDGTYDFIIYDVYGDGICCDWGEGSYQLAFGDDIVATGGSFGQSETKTFSTPITSNPAQLPSTLPPDECYDVIITQNFDMYPQDESWDITQDGVIVASSPQVAADATQDVQELCLPMGDYVFTIYDLYGDGMCCQWGEGNYVVSTNNDEIIADGAEFGPSESTAFTLP